MARTNNLTNYLTDVADAIKAKKGDNTPILASDFDTEIANLPSGGKMVFPQGIKFDNSTFTSIDFSNSDFSQIGSAQNLFQNNTTMQSISNLDLSGIDNVGFLFYGCSALTTLTSINTKDAYDFSSLFYNCTSLVTAPELDTSGFLSGRVGYYNMFRGCTNLENVPVYNATNMGNLGFSNMFRDCTKLTDTSLDNILQTCINATGYAGTKTLAQLKITTTNYPASKIQALPHYQAFVNAGWSIS